MSDVSLRQGVRFRITAAATLVVAVVLVMGALTLALIQRQTLTDTLDETLRQRADAISGLVGDSLPPELPQTGSEGFSQLVDARGQVLASSANLTGAAPLFEATTGESRDVFRTTVVPDVDDDTFRVLTRSLGTGEVVHVGTTYDVVGEATSAVATALLVTMPVLVVILGAVVWWLVGRTLRPVEAIRSEVAEIGSGDLHRRLPNPGTRDEIEDLAATMNAMLERLEGAAVRQRQFVADASHELRSPLTRLRSAIEVERKVPTGNAGLVELLEDVAAMQAMVDDLLYLARVDESAVPPATYELDLDDVVLEEVRSSVAGSVSIDTRAVSGAHVNGDRGQLARAVRNLLDNALRHARSEVTIKLAREGGLAVLTVQDDGPGIPRADLERVFQRFARLDEARSSGSGGTGLGLAIARDVARRHGGDVTAIAAQETGACLVMTLPSE